MKKWEQFVFSKDYLTEEKIKKIYQAERKALKTISYSLYRNVGNSWEKQTEQVSSGALWRCCTCIESMLILLREGYYGSANALFRQVYEFLSWAKLSIDSNDDIVLAELHDSFYAEIDEKRRTAFLTPFFKRTSFISESETGKPEDVRDIGKRLFEHYALV